jgi:uncharacterized membrane protein
MNRQRLFYWGFIASLALNAFFITGFITHALHDRHGPFGPPGPPGAPGMPMPDRMVEDLAQTLSEPDATILKQAYNAQRDVILADLAATEKMPESVRTLLAAEPFDPDQLRAALAQGFQARQKLETDISEIAATTLGKISADGRRRILSFDRRHGPPRDHRGPQDPPPPR